MARGKTDDLADEIIATVRNKALMELLAEGSKEEKRIPLSEVRARLKLKKPRSKARKPVQRH